MSKIVTVSQLFNALLALPARARPIGFSALTEIKASKTGNPFVGIFKLSRVSAFAGFDYENSVNRQLDREGKSQLHFTAAPRKWGTRISPLLVEHKGAHYLTVKVEKTRKPVYLVRDALLGTLRPVSKEIVAAFLPPSYHAANQGTDKEIVYRDYSLASLVSIALDKELYKVRRETVPALTA